MCIEGRNNNPAKIIGGHMEDFTKEMSAWLQTVNSIIQKKQNDIILENKYFDRDELSKQYTVNRDALKQMLSAEYLFIGDNPGENEKLHYTYFYYNAKDIAWIKENRSSAGTKIHKFIERAKLSDDQFVKFNKCLIFSKSTSDLALSQIELTQKIVIEFLKILRKHNGKIKIIVMGLNSKFHSMYKLLIKEFPDIIITPHPCSSLYKYNKAVVVKATTNLDIDDFCKQWKNKNIIKGLINKDGKSN